MKVENVVNEAGWAGLQEPTALWIAGRNPESTTLRRVHLENSLTVHNLDIGKWGKLAIFKKDTYFQGAKLN